MAMPLLALALLLTLPTVSIAQPSVLERPQVKVGDHWRIRISTAVADGPIEAVAFKPAGEYDYRVSSMERGLIEVRDKNEDVGLLLDAGSFAALRSGGVAIDDGAFQRVIYPLAPGKTWKSAYGYASSACGRTEVTASFQADGWEDVEVPAGRFRALRVNFESVAQNECGKRKLLHIQWWAPRLLVPIKQRSQSPFGDGRWIVDLHELISFGPSNDGQTP